MSDMTGSNDMTDTDASKKETRFILFMQVRDMKETYSKRHLMMERRNREPMSDITNYHAVYLRPTYDFRKIFDERADRQVLVSAAIGYPEMTEGAMQDVDQEQLYDVFLFYRDMEGTEQPSSDTLYHMHHITMMYKSLAALRNLHTKPEEQANATVVNQRKYTTTPRYSDYDAQFPYELSGFELRTTYVDVEKNEQDVRWWASADGFPYNTQFEADLVEMLLTQVRAVCFRVT
ncbi:hypothetical protein EJ05DRAFT_522778 [Pseudovirgaria hyperparasitica]|uniref:Uncharacterized protein n=1 Tax=Pseudovirgaria hyperparasitica TaxID=470096 RepID=A0A6A6VVQ2_9PEZI|nr:uncharacterized protein EJ05DRAFT_522778 [Pseudovirgaria hyperparasitica]KAF2753321.1 hypothetical protein EJ05DRAFT_522778 [Pseudovirgaria hyperparasitica]